MISPLIRSFRAHQWVKNLLLFVPVVTAHHVSDPQTWSTAALSFVCFCLCASAGYIVNDLFDAAADREHERKCTRPIASGEVSSTFAAASALLMMCAGFGLATLLPLGFLYLLLVYVALSVSYSWFLKRVCLIDIFVLAAFYTIRIIAGGAATNIEVSAWLLAFSMFLFLSLALVKRCVELKDYTSTETNDSNRRPYTPADREQLARLGTSSGYLSVLVFSLYINSDKVVELYHRPMLLWLLCPVLLYWISRVWLLADRGQLHDDPIVFALKDPVSYLTGIIALAVMFIAS